MHIRLPFILLLFLFESFSGYYAHAQGWLGGRGNTGCGMDGWAVATDPSGNVFVAGITLGGMPAVFGAYTVPFTGISSGWQCIIAKYDPSGNILWAKGVQNGASNLINIATDQN